MEAPTYSNVKEYVIENFGDFAHYLKSEHGFTSALQFKALSIYDKLAIMLCFYCKAHNI